MFSRLQFCSILNYLATVVARLICHLHEFATPSKEPADKRSSHRFIKSGSEYSSRHFCSPACCLRRKPLFVLVRVPGRISLFVTSHEFFVQPAATYTTFDLKTLCSRKLMPRFLWIKSRLHAISRVASRSLLLAARISCSALLIGWSAIS